VKEAIMAEPNEEKTPDPIADKLLSAGTPADSPGIQLLETVAVVGAALTIGSIILLSWMAVVAVVLTAAAGYGAHWLRRKRLLRNEEEARAARYAYPEGREETIRGLVMPEDLKSATLGLIGQPRMSRLEIAARLSARVGETRANEYLPLILLQADRSMAS
jgi:hypothetical protein